MFVAQNVKIQAYINDVCLQIKFREVHQEIKLELKTHLQELVDEYLLQGLSEDEAVNKAIIQMGSADIVGKQLHKIHKPKPEWSLLALSLLFVGSGLLAMFFIEKQGLFLSGHIPIFIRSLVLTIMGAVTVVGLYLFNYRRLEPFSRHIYWGTVLFLVMTFIMGQRVNGKLYLSIGSILFDFVEITPLLLGIALSGILSKWNWNDFKRMLQGFLLCLLPLIFILASPSLTAGVIYTVTCITLVIVSGAGPRKALLLAGIVSGIVILPIITTSYRLQRLIIFLNPERDPSGSGWLNIQLSELISSSGLYGHGITQKPALLPALHTEFIFSYITYTFGWIAGGVLAALVVMFIIHTTRIAAIVKNNYAKLLITGFATIFAVQFLWNIAMNLGYTPISGVGLPFVSYGGSQLIFNAAALGIILSIYRRRYIQEI